MFSLITNGLGVFGTNIRVYKNFILIGLLFVIVCSIFYYIHILNNRIQSRDKDIVILKKELLDAHDKSVRDKLVYQINEKTLNDAITSQNNIIEKFRMDQVKAMKTYKDSIVKITSDYESKIQSVRDSNISEAVEYKTLTGIIDKELK